MAVLSLANYSDFSPESTCAIFMATVFLVNAYNNRDIILPALQNFWQPPGPNNDTTNKSACASLKCD